MSHGQTVEKSATAVGEMDQSTEQGHGGVFGYQLSVIGCQLIPPCILYLEPLNYQILRLKSEALKSRRSSALGHHTHLLSRLDDSEGKASLHEEISEPVLIYFGTLSNNFGTHSNICYNKKIELYYSF